MSIALSKASQLKDNGKKKKVKKKPQSWYRKKAIELAKTIAKVRDNYTCQKCGASQKNGAQIHGSHILSVGAHPTISADPLNIKALCAKCHSPNFKGSWHEDPKGQEWFDIKFPNRIKELREREVELLGKQNWEEVYLSLKKLIC